MIAASSPIMASTQTISISANPASLRQRPRRPFLTRAADDIGCCATAAFLTVGAQRDDLVGRALARRTVEIAMAPGVVWHHAPAQIRPVPARRVVAAPQRGQAFTAVRIAAEVAIIEVDRRG